MTHIKKYVEQIEEELHDSKCYIEKALEYKAMGNADRYNGYKELSMNELNHAMRLHDYAVQDINKLREVYPEIPQKMQDAWDRAHVEYVEKTAWIKQMQSM